MFALIELIFLVFLLPFILFGFLLARIYEAIASAFQPHIFMAGVWAFISGLCLVPIGAPDDAPFQNIAQMLARGHILGLETPYTLMAAGVTLVVLAAIIRFSRNRHAN